MYTYIVFELTCADAVYYRRKQDVDTPTGEWFDKLSKKDNWLWKTVPNVRYRGR